MIIGNARCLDGYRIGYLVGADVVQLLPRVEFGRSALRATKPRSQAALPPGFKAVLT